MFKKQTLCLAALIISLSTSLSGEARTSRTIHSHSASSSSQARSKSTAGSSRHSGRGRSRSSARSTRVASRHGRHSYSRHHRIAIDNGERGIEPPPQVNPNSSSNASAYQLYDRGVNQNLSGDFSGALSNLTHSSQLLHAEMQPQASTLQMMVDLELGRAAESSGNAPAAQNAYLSCIKSNPRCVDAYIRLVGLLIQSGEPLLALSRAKECVQASPTSARAHSLYADVLTKNGFDDDAKFESDRSRALINESTSNPR